MGEVTYQQLFDVLRKERSREELQDLSEEFFVSCTEYVQGQQATLASHEPLSSEAESIRTQLQNALKMLKELYDRREKKVMHLALNKARTGSDRVESSSLLASERPLYQSILSLLNEHRQQVLPVGAQNIVSKPAVSRPVVSSPKKAPSSTRSEKPAEGSSDGVEVVIKRSTPRFLGSANQTFGPYEEGAKVELPDRIAQILIKKGRAELAGE